VLFLKINCDTWLYKSDSISFLFLWEVSFFMVCLKRVFICIRYNIFLTNNSFMHLFIHSFIRSFIHSFIHLFIFIFLFTYLVIYVCNTIYLYLKCVFLILIYSYLFVCLFISIDGLIDWTIVWVGQSSHMISPSKLLTLHFFLLDLYYAKGCH